MVFNWGGVLEFRFLGDADELLDVVPLALEKGGIIRDGVIGVVGSGDTTQNRKLAV